MEDANIPQADGTNAFKLCLEGKARQWYDEIAVPPQWNDLMTLFCGCFCIYGRTHEEWYDAWQKLNYDRVNRDIEDFLTDVKRLAQLNDINDQMILSKLKQIFPEKEDIWLLVHDVDNMYQHLRHFYSPYKWKMQAASKTTQGANPFSNMERGSEQYVLNLGEKPHKEVTFNEYNFLEDTIDKLTTVIGKLNKKKSGNRYDNPPPMVSPLKTVDGMTRTTSLTSPKIEINFNLEVDLKTNLVDPIVSPTPRDRDRNRSCSHGRSCNRDKPQPWYDKSPTVRKPRSSSRPVNKDKDRCFKCHQYGHLAKDCPEAQKALVAQVLELLDSPRVFISAVHSNQSPDTDYDEMIAQLAQQDLNQ